MVIKIKRINKLLLAVFILMAVFSVNSPAAKADEYFVINNYQVNITVLENNTLIVGETIEVEFNTARHGIYRTIPIRGSFDRTSVEGASDTNFNAKISNISVEGYEYTTYNEGNNKVIKIGDPDVYVNGVQTYNIYYTYDFGDDGIEEFDEFYFNLIGTQWDTYIYNAQITVLMPKEFDQSKVGLSSGYKGIIGSSILDYTVEGNKITVHTTSLLHPYEGITMRIELPEGYFVNERVPYDWTYVYYIGTALLFIIIFILWATVGKDDKIYPAAEFYPPEGLTPAEIGYAVDGTVDAKDVISLLLYWADKGYIKIEERKKSDFYIIKLQPLPDEAEYYEHRMFSDLFRSRPSFDIGDLMDLIKGQNNLKEFENSLIEKVDSAEIMSFVRVKELNNVFYTTVDAVKKMIRDKYKDGDGNRIFTVKSIVAKVVTFILFTLPIFFGILVLKAPYAQDRETVVVGSVFLCSFIVIMFATLDYLVRGWHSKKKLSKIFKAVILFAVLVALFFSALAVMLPSVEKFLSTFIITAASFLMGIMGLFMHKRTPEMNKLQERILGLKDFLYNAEKDRIDQLVKENPDYFYNVLSYAYVLGVTNKWAKQFEHIAMEPPRWYAGYRSVGHFSAASFESSLSKGFRSMTNTMSSSPSSSSGGGGGSSGGGGGGGGGGSW